MLGLGDTLQLLAPVLWLLPLPLGSLTGGSRPRFSLFAEFTSLAVVSRLLRFLAPGPLSLFGLLG